MQEEVLWFLSDDYKSTYEIFTKADELGLFVMRFIEQLRIHTGKNLCFTEFSTKIHRNTRLAASDVFHMFTQLIKFF